MSHNLLKAWIWSRIQENIKQNMVRKASNSLPKRLQSIKADRTINQLCHQLLDRCACCGRRIPVSGPKGHKEGLSCRNGKCSCK